MARALVAAKPRSLMVWTAASTMRERVPSRMDRATAPFGPDLATAVAPITLFDQLLKFYGASPGFSTPFLESGDPLPDFSYGFRTKFGFKGVGLSLFFRGEQGRQLFNNRALIFQTKSAAAQGRGFFAEALNDPDAFDEAPRFSDRWIEDASFIKLDNITLDYGLNRLLNTRRVRNARVFLSVDNAFTITPYSGYDPEVNTNAQVGRIAALGIDYTNYPVPRTITLGFNLGF